MKIILYSLFSILYTLSPIPYPLSPIPCLYAEISGAGASDEWGKFQKTIFIQQGLSIPSWEGRYTYSALMEPVGDGTYQIRFDLIPGSDYNFIFFAFSTQTVAGLQTNTTYYDTIPNSGSDIAFITAITTINPLQNNTGDASYTSIFYENSWHGRRKVRIPEWIEPGTTFYVYCNWASTPSAPTNFRARPGNGYVHLSWGPPYGHWGSGSELYKAIDVIAGGAYNIYRSSVSASGPYEIVASTPGYCFEWTDTSVQNGIRYYYAISSSDAYKGSASGVFGDLNLSSDIERSPLLAATPGEAVPIRFRVEGIDWEKIRKNDYLVWLTPDNAPDKYSSRYKVQARILTVLPRAWWQFWKI